MGNSVPTNSYGTRGPVGNITQSAIAEMRGDTGLTRQQQIDNAYKMSQVFNVPGSYGYQHPNSYDGLLGDASRIHLARLERLGYRNGTFYT